MRHVFEFFTNQGRVGVPHASVIELSVARGGKCCAAAPAGHATVRTATPSWVAGGHTEGEWHAIEAVDVLIARLNACAAPDATYPSSLDSAFL